ncbi:MAG: hypothetical protein P8183_08410, partial [Anaerolineae bacterium]
WTRQAYRRKRWDGYLIPGPFAHIHVAFGPPIFAEADMPTDSLLDRITNALHQAMNQARAAASTLSPAINAE